MNSIETLRFLNRAQVEAVANRFATPTFVYSQSLLTAQAKQALAFSAPFGLSVRYAMKANPHRALLRLFSSLGLGIDASSGFEAERALAAGIEPRNILLTAQELPANFTELVGLGINFNACSLYQLEEYGRAFRGQEVSLRINPGVGGGHSAKTSVGGRKYGFGIWHEQIADIQKLVKRYQLSVVRLHSHTGTGADTNLWPKAAGRLLAMAKDFRAATVINLGGGLKVGRMSYEQGADGAAYLAPVAQMLKRFFEQTSRKLQLEIEPGTFLTANAGALVCRVVDIVHTGQKGYKFVKLNSGMTELLRPMLYGSQHPIIILGRTAGQTEYVVIGHCCESGDLLSPSLGHAAEPAPRRLAKARVGDLAVIEGVGAYGAAMSAIGYNSFPRAAEVMLKPSGQWQLISRRQNLNDLMAYER